MTVAIPRRLFKKPGPYTDNDEAARRRAQAINRMAKAYEAGGAYNDIDSSKPAEEAFDASKDYDMLQRVRSLKHTRLPKKKG